MGPRPADHLAAQRKRQPTVAILALLLLISLAVAAAFLGAFWWAVRDGQYEDEHTPSVRMLFDDDPAD